MYNSSYSGVIVSPDLSLIAYVPLDWYIFALLEEYGESVRNYSIKKGVVKKSYDNVNYVMISISPASLDQFYFCRHYFKSKKIFEKFHSTLTSMNYIGEMKKFFETVGIRIKGAG